MNEEFDAIQRSDDMNRQRNKNMIEDNIAASQMVIANQAAMLAHGLVNNPDFFHESGTE
jgi:hypothetical protein